IEIIRGPLGPAASPTELRTGGDVVDSRGPIPRRADVPFHIGVVSEEFAVRVERQIVGIAEPARELLDATAVDVGADNRRSRRGNAYRMSAGVFVSRLVEIAFVNDLVRTLRIRGSVDAGEVADHQVEQAIRTKLDPVRSVLAGRADEFHDWSDFVGRAVA